MKKVIAMVLTVASFVSTILIIASIISFAFAVPVTAKAQLPVNLGTSGNFAVLAKTGISTTGTTSITGIIGISPAAATYINGFGLIMDPSGTFSTSSVVVEKIYASDYTDPTPSKMTTAIGDMETAYTNAAGRTLPDYTELYTGDLTGKTLAPGLYNWSTGVLISAAGATISGSSSDIWIFEISGNLTVANGAMVILAGGAKASNIFWQVAGNVTIGTTAAMKGIILCQTGIAMSTNATLLGSALSQTAVTLDANVITSAAMLVAVDKKNTPPKHSLSQNYSNRSIEFAVPFYGRAKLTIKNIMGQQVATLFNGNIAAQTKNRVQINTNGLAKGLYLSILEFNGNVNEKQILLIE